MTSCARCFTPEPAITRVHFAYESSGYYLDLCSEHEQRFESDMLGWIRLAESARPAPPAPALSSVPELPRMSANLLRVPFPVTNGGVEEHDAYPDLCPPAERARTSHPGAQKYDEEEGEKYVARVLMQPRR